MNWFKKLPGFLRGLIILVSLYLVFWGVVNLFPVKQAVEGENPWRKDDLTLITAHREGAELNPENTKKAFDYVIRETTYTDIVEFDVRLTIDNELVIIHDASIDRTGIKGYDKSKKNTEGEIIVREHTYEQLCNYNLGVNFEIDGVKPYENLPNYKAKQEGLTIMRLEDFLKEYKNDRYFRVYLEIKDSGNDGKKAVDEAERLLALPEYSMWSERVMFISFSTDAVNYTLEKYPHRYVAGMGYNVIGTLAGSKLWLNPLFNPKFQSIQTSMKVGKGFVQFNCATQNFVDAAHKRNQSVCFWTINNEEDMRYLISLGVDGITTDRPDLLAKVLGKN